MQRLLHTFYMPFGFTFLFESRSKIVVGGEPFSFDPPFIIEIGRERIPLDDVLFLGFALLVLIMVFGLVAFPLVILSIFFMEFDFDVTVVVELGVCLGMFVDLFGGQQFLVCVEIVRDVDVNILLRVKHKLRIINWNSKYKTP